uniref:Phosphomannomutase n=1 Tax=Glossina palpalis gambiensis TaxID=67801 RepID=A0A1B0C3G1_9MUSC
MIDFLIKLRTKISIEYIGESLLEKHQLEEKTVQFYKENQLMSFGNVLTYVDENFYRKFLDIVLRYLSKLGIPKQNEYLYRVKKSYINISQIVRNYSKEESVEFLEYDT